MAPGQGTGVLGFPGRGPGSEDSSRGGFVRALRTQHPLGPPSPPKGPLKGAAVVWGLAGHWLWFWSHPRTQGPGATVRPQGPQLSKSRGGGGPGAGRVGCPGGSAGACRDSGRARLFNSERCPTRSAWPHFADGKMKAQRTEPLTRVSPHNCLQRVCSGPGAAASPHPTPELPLRGRCWVWCLRRSWGAGALDAQSACSPLSGSAPWPERLAVGAGAAGSL